MGSEKVNEQGKASTGHCSTNVTRRSFMQTVGVSAAAGAVQTHTERAFGQPVDGENAGAPAIGPGATRVTLRINGADVSAEIEPATTLLEFLRWQSGLTGAKEVCDRGSCGACSVLLDGRLVTSCMTLAADAIGREVTTVEGLADGDDLDPIQEAFIQHDALQCGFCTPGLVMACKALFDENPKPTLDEIKAGLAGNLCRCGTYSNVFNAALTASGQSPLMDGGRRNG